MVVTWLHRAREAEERRRMAEEQPLVLGSGASDTRDVNSSGDENDDPDEVVYDIQVWRCTRNRGFPLSFRRFLLTRI